MCLWEADQWCKSGENRLIGARTVKHKTKLLRLKLIQNLHRQLCSNIQAKTCLPDGCQFLMPDCSAIQGASQQYAASWKAAEVFRVSREHPAKIGKPIEIT